jgi:hypothetical protein
VGGTATHVDRQEILSTIDKSKSPAFPKNYKDNKTTGPPEI